MNKAIRKYVLANAYGHGGKAQVGAVIGKLIGAGHISKSDIGKVRKDIDKTIRDVSKLSTQKQEVELKKIYPKFFEAHIETKTLPKVRGKVVTRFEPSPSGPMHIGHAYTLADNLELARQNKGRCILRVSDTNPENISPDAYKLLKEDAKWLSNGFIKDKDFFIQSDRIKIYYKHAEKALRIGAAYVCTCESKAWHDLMIKSLACPCRAAKDHLARWKYMLKDWPEGKAVVRIKTDLKHKNPAMRDWPALRINTHRHPRQGKKYRVWPLMNFAVAIDDYEMGITHTFRAKEHRDAAKRQKYLYDAFGWKMAQHWYLGAVNFIGLKLSTTKTRQDIEAGEYEGWNDVRLPFLIALRRRGYQPETFVKYGLAAASENDKTVRSDEFFKLIDKLNRETIDKKADRYFFVSNPIEVKVDLAKNVKLKVHPEKKKTRVVKVSKMLYVDAVDFKKFKGKNIRLKGLANVILGETAKVVNDKETQTVHWVANPHCKVAILMPNNKWSKGIGEPSIAKIKVGEIVQFERFGFVKCESKGKFIFGHH
tara:strand:+ start:1401 stop:3014 length:1614 start_codon:yes stop_codon:yes gene_type:complete